MAIRPHPKYKGAWIIDIRPYGYQGKRERIPFEGTETEARAAELEFMRSTRRPDQLSAPRIADLYPEWIANHKNDISPATLRDVLSCYKKNLLPFFGTVRPNLLTHVIIDQYKAGRLAAGIKKRTVNKELSYLSSMLKWCSAPGRNYCAPLSFRITGYPRKQTKPPPPRPLSIEEINRVLAAIEPEYKLIFLLMTDAGLRRTEALTLRANQVDMRCGLISLRGKGSKDRVIPIMTERLYEELACKEDIKGYLSVNRKTGLPYHAIRKPLLRAAKSAGLEGKLYHHLLRHSFGTIATASGIRLKAVQMMLGHSDPATTAIYQHLAAEFLQEEGRKFRSG